MAASKTERTTDSKNRRPGCAVITIHTPTVVADGAVDTSIGAIEFDSHLYDLDEGTRGTHMRERSTLEEAVACGVFTPEEAQTFGEWGRRFYNALDYIAENRTPPTSEEV